MNRWHRMSKYFRALPTMERRISFAITGATDPAFPYDFPDVGRRFQRYQAWLAKPDVFSLRFEDLTSEGKEQVLRDVMAFYAARSDHEMDVDACVVKAMENIKPYESHTFRKGKSGAWQDEFTQEHKDLFKKVAGKLLIDLGYENDLNW